MEQQQNFQNQELFQLSPVRYNNSYSMKTIHFWCHSCRREFSRLMNSEICSEVFCGRCHNVCEMIAPGNNPRDFNIYQEAASGAEMSQSNSSERSSRGTLTSRAQPAHQTEAAASANGPAQRREEPMLFHFVTFTHFVPDPFYLLLLQELAAAGSNRENQGAPPASEKEMFLIKQYQLLSDEHKGEDPCSICQEVFCKGEYVSEMPCNHKFHKSCLDGWIGIHNTCPICRKSLAEN